MNNSALDSKATLTIFNSLLEESEHEAAGVNAKKFRAKNYKHKELIASLESRQLIRRDSEKYFISLIGLYELRQENKNAEHLLASCDSIFHVLKSFYEQNAGEDILLSDLAKQAAISRDEVNAIRVKAL